MKRMIYFEWKKLFDRKLNVTAMLAGYLLILVCVVYSIKNFSCYDKESHSYINGLEGFRLSREKNEEMTDFLTEDYLTRLTESIQAKNIPLNTDEGYIEMIRPMYDMLWVLCNNYTDIRGTFDWKTLNKIATENGIGFYKRRIEKVEIFLNTDFSFGNYSEAEKAFWLAMEQKVDTPFQWGDKSSMDFVWDMILIAFSLVFVIAICISPIFASEHESGAVALLLTAKNGKNRLIYAKMIVAVLFSTFYMTFGIGLGIASVGLTVGIHGAMLPVQLWGTIIPYNWSVGFACTVSFAMMLLIALTVTLFTAFLSSKTKASTATLVIDFLLLAGSALLPMSKESSLWNHINYLFPVKVMNVKEVIKTFNSYQLGSVILPYLKMAAGVYLTIGALSVMGVKRNFIKY